jgi:hypothetical protein
MAPSSSFNTTFCDALKRYRDKTKNDLALHPLTADLQNCKLPADILTILDRKYNVQAFIQSNSGDRTSQQSLNATFTVLASFSSAIGEGVGLVRLQLQMLVNHPSSGVCLFVCRYSHLQKRSSLVSASFLWSASPFVRANHSHTILY